jgi:hypothetical protein
MFARPSFPWRGLCRFERRHTDHVRHFRRRRTWIKIAHCNFNSSDLSERTMAGIHTPERKAAAAAGIRAAWSAGRYANAAAKRKATLIANGTEPMRRVRVSESMRAFRSANRPVQQAPVKRALAMDATSVRGRAVMTRLRARRRLIDAGLPVPAHLQSQRAQRPFWPTVDAATARIDAQRAAAKSAAFRGRDTDAAHAAILQGPMWEWYAVGAIAHLADVTSDPAMVSHARPRNEGAATWSQVHGLRHSAELTQLIRAQQADASNNFANNIGMTP